ncbi:hypothetical protein SAMN04487857_1122 [Pseudomonas sp. ok272]|nr:hypothetical protein SAMN04487857_1122 [Pseudomonas sp. ok272]SFN14021.1 hypothetical protein SAMN04487858_1132 [Pseudomonas sp. ok602]
MTSLVFIFAVVPQAIATGVIGGMSIATLAMLFVVEMKMVRKRHRDR